MAWKSHWQPKDRKTDWADDIRSDLSEVLDQSDKLETLENMNRKDLYVLAQAIKDLKAKKK